MAILYLWQEALLLEKAQSSSLLLSQVLRQDTCSYPSPTLDLTSIRPFSIPAYLSGLCKSKIKIVCSIRSRDTWRGGTEAIYQVHLTQNMREDTVRLAPDPLRKSKSARMIHQVGLFIYIINTNPILMKFERSILPEPVCWAFFPLEHWKSEWYSKF